MHLHTSGEPFDAERAIQVGATVLVAAGVFVAVVLGPLVTGVIEYHVSRDATVQYIGGEVITAMAAVAIIVSSRRPRTASLLRFRAGAASYLLYTMVTVVFGQDYLRYDGNAERWFGVFVCITVGAVFLLGDAVAQLFRSTFNEYGRTPRISLAVIGTLFAVLWISAVIQNAQEPSAEYLADPSLFWLIKYIDLGLIVPVAIVSSVVWTRSYHVAGMVVLSFSMWMMAAIAGMQIAMILLAEAPTALFTVASVMIVGASWCSYLTIKHPRAQLLTNL